MPKLSCSALPPEASSSQARRTSLRWVATRLLRQYPAEHPALGRAHLEPQRRRDGRGDVAAPDHGQREPAAHVGGERLETASTIRIASVPPVTCAYARTSWSTPVDDPLCWTSTAVRVGAQRLGDTLGRHRLAVRGLKLDDLEAVRAGMASQRCAKVPALTTTTRCRPGGAAESGDEDRILTARAGEKTCATSR